MNWDIVFRCYRVVTWHFAPLDSNAIWQQGCKVYHNVLGWSKSLTKEEVVSVLLPLFVFSSVPQHLENGGVLWLLYMQASILGILEIKKTKPNENTNLLVALYFLLDWIHKLPGNRCKRHNIWTSKSNGKGDLSRTVSCKGLLTLCLLFF